MFFEVWSLWVSKSASMRQTARVYQSN